MKSSTVRFAAAVCAVLCTSATVSQAATMPQDRIKNVVDNAIRPLMTKDGIPGMAVGVSFAGKSYVYNYGVASLETRQPVTRDTLFEIGSVSKTFTATLASYAQVSGYLSLQDKTGKYLPSLSGTPFGEVSLLNLGTHTPGGLPLQVPDNIHNDAQLLSYFKAWQPAYPPGTYRTYANPGSGTLGWITAKSMGQDFTVLIEQKLFPALGMKNSHIDVPPAKMADYAQGYSKTGMPIRMRDGVLAAEAYGVKSTAADLLRFIDANMHAIPLDTKLQRAIDETHTGYVRAGPMIQDLIWEQYPYPVALPALLQGNGPSMLDAIPVTEIKPPLAPRADAWINKTGSTNGFGAYIAFVPGKRVGIVILANKNTPLGERVNVAYKIMSQLDAEGATHD
ncbi:MAG: beta-lactamase [Aquitalea sp.]|nr:beta-lactamase [Aquitalea sp.]